MDNRKSAALLTETTIKSLKEMQAAHEASTRSVFTQIQIQIENNKALKDENDALEANMEHLLEKKKRGNLKREKEIKSLHDQLDSQKAENAQLQAESTFKIQQFSEIILTQHQQNKTMQLSHIAVLKGMQQKQKERDEENAKLKRQIDYLQTEQYALMAAIDLKSGTYFESEECNSDEEHDMSAEEEHHTADSVDCDMLEAASEFATENLNSSPLSAIFSPYATIATILDDESICLIDGFSDQEHVLIAYKAFVLIIENQNKEGNRLERNVDYSLELLPTNQHFSSRFQIKFDKKYTHDIKKLLEDEFPGIEIQHLEKLQSPSQGQNYSRLNISLN